MNCSTPGFPVLCYPLEFAQIHVHWVGDTVQPSHPLLPLLLLPSVFPSIIAFQMSQLFAAGGESIGVSASTSVLPINTQGWFTLGLTGFIFLQFKGFSIVFSNTTLWKHQFFGIHPSLWFHSHIHTWLLEKNISLTIWTFVDKVMSGCMNYSLNVQSASLGLS